MPIEQFLTSFGRAALSGGKGTIVDPLVKLSAIALLGILALTYAKSSPTVILIVAAILGAVVVMILGVYIWCLAKNQTNLLRSERFNLNQMAIQKTGLRGDDLQTFLRLVNLPTELQAGTVTTPPPISLPASPAESEAR